MDKLSAQKQRRDARIITALEQYTKNNEQRERCRRREHKSERMPFMFHRHGGAFGIGI
jgi:hypothetical protein